MTFSKASFFSAIVMAVFLFSCSEPSHEAIHVSHGETVVDSSIAYHGRALYQKADLSFGFRQRDYRAVLQGGRFEYLNTYRDSLGRHERKLTNEGYSQKLNDSEILLSEKDSAGRAASVNSVIYFALLPGMLNTPAARKEYLGEETIEGRRYHKVRVTFSEEGGGEDFDDVFLYWFSVDDYAMDYLAYSYLEDEGGSRFRKAYNRRSVNGLVFQDYYNLRGPSPDSLEFISELFKAGALDTLSLIEVDKLSVTPL